MKYVKQIFIIFTVSMIGELLNQMLPLPVPAGVYGLFLMLLSLCCGLIRLEDVEMTGHLLLDLMPLMFIPVTVELVDRYQDIQSIAVPVTVISLVSTIIVMIVSGKVTEWIMKLKGRTEQEK